MTPSINENSIFLHSGDMRAKCLIGCLQSLLECFPNIKFSAVVSNEEAKGFKVCFENFKANKVLERRFIIVENQMIYIYPSTTYLVFKNVNIVESESSNKDQLIKEIENKLGVVLKHEVWIPHRTNLSITTRNSGLKLLIDIPEVKHLKIFKKYGYPDLDIYIPGLHQTFTASILCRNCMQLGHFFSDARKWGCSNAIDVNERTLRGDSPLITSINSSQQNRQNLASKVKTFYYDASSQGFSKSSSYEELTTSFAQQQTRPSTSSTQYHSGPTRTSSRDQQAVTQSTTLSSSPPFFETPQKIDITDISKLSSTLQEIIKDSCYGNGLSREYLDLFLHNVFGKKKVARVISKYTKNKKALKAQLNQIIRSHYKRKNIPSERKARDNSFIKWLEKVKDRFTEPLKKEIRLKIF